MVKTFIFILLFLLAMFCGLPLVKAQTNGFTYQGSLTDGGAAANGNYDITVEIYDADTGGNLLGTANFTSIPVVNGVFTVNIGANPSIFPGAARYLQLKVKRAGAAGSFTTLTPRQMVTSTPYALKSLTADNALNLGGVSAGQFIQSNDARLTDARNPLAGSTSYIQNGTNPQAASNFNISGNGIIGGRLGVGTSNPQFSLHVVGQDVRVESTTGVNNFPRFSWNYTSGPINERKWQAYASVHALNFSALDEFEETEAVWMQVKRLSGSTNIENIVFPSPTGIVGIGTWTPQAKLHIEDTNTLTSRPVTLRVTSALAGGTIASFGEKGYFQVDAPGTPGGRLNIYENGTVILGDCPGCFGGVTDRLVVNGNLRVTTLSAGGSQSVCRNNAGQLASCSSSIRYKQNIQDYRPGLDLVKRLRPVSFNWKADGQEDMGLVAEEVAAVEPLLTTQNEKGETEGVKYDRVGVVLVNAVKEQQTQIEALQKENQELKSRLEALEKLMREQTEQNQTKEVKKEN